jgi:hypothetical protein
LEVIDNYKMQRRSFLSRFLGAICGILSSPFSTKELVPYKIIKTTPLNIVSKQLKAKWTIDIHQDLVQMHGKWYKNKCRLG